MPGSHVADPVISFRSTTAVESSVSISGAGTALDLKIHQMPYDKADQLAQKIGLTVMMRPPNSR